MQLVEECIANEVGLRPSTDVVLQRLEQMEMDNPYKNVTRLEMMRMVGQEEQTVAESQRKDREIQRRDEELRQMEAEMGWKEQTNRQREEEIQQMGEESQRKDGEIQQRDEELRQMEAEMGRKEQTIQQNQRMSEGIQQRDIELG